MIFSCSASPSKKGLEPKYRKLGNGKGHSRGVGKLTRTLTREDRVLDLKGWPEKKSSKTVKKWLRYVQNTSFDDFTVVLIITQSILNRFA